MLPAVRQTGVRIPDDQLTQGQGAPNTVGHVIPAQMVAVQYFDEYGKGHNTVLLRVGTELYHAPNGEQWAAALKQAAPWLKEVVMPELDSEKVPIPTEDEVDVVASETAAELDEVQKAP